MASAVGKRREGEVDRQQHDHAPAILHDACAFANSNMLAKYDVKNPVAVKEGLSRLDGVAAVEIDPQDGRITAVGKHSELLATNDHYRYVISSLDAAGEMIS